MEKNPFKRAWIWFWFNDATRFLLVLCGGHLLILVPLLVYAGVSGEALRTATIAAYLLGILVAMCDNDYTKLHRIGLDVYRRPLRNTKPTDDEHHA